MRRRRWLALAGVLVGFGVLLGAAPAAWSSYIVIPECTSGGQTSACGAGWYTSDVSLGWTWSPQDGGNPIDGCIPHSYVDDTNTTVSCTISGPSGKTSTSQPLNVETSTPTASIFLSRAADSNDWYNHPVTATIDGSSFSGIASCTPSMTYAGPDALTASISGSCVDNAGKVADTGVTLHHDATPPTVSGWSASRAPDVHGWYNHPVTFNFSGTDAMSGLAGCTTPTYAGPGSAHASVIGTCTDRAGNVATLGVPLRYDSTPPRLDVASGTGDHVVGLRWQASSWPAPLRSLKIRRTSSTGGGSKTIVEHPGNGTYTDTDVSDFVRYRYTITADDQAGNVSVRTVTAVPGPRLLWPPSGIHLAAPPLLLWTPVRGADYYNVQLYRGDHKVLSIWPGNAKLRIRHSWSFQGHRFKLKPGVYHWYVWPGYGARAAARYGRLIGRGTFVIVRR